jgi:hypothetical protein
MQLMDNRKAILGRLIWVLPVLVLMGCKVQMTLSGSSVPEDVNTVSVQYFENRAPLINPLLSQTFTESLKDRITSESRLVIKDEIGDVDFSGEITGYDLRPMAIQANAISAETRMTITVRVRYHNYNTPQQNWESSFSAYADFESSQNITAIESELVRDIVDQITENIFNRAFSDW